MDARLMRLVPTARSFWKPSRTSVVLSPKQPPTKAVEVALPGARIATWKERELPLRGQAAKAYDFLVERLSDGSVRELSKREVSHGIGITKSSNFARNVMRHPAFRAALEREGIVVRHRHFEWLKAEPD